MLGNNQELRNRKPRSEGEAHLQGMEVKNHHTTGNYTARAELEASHSRYDKGMELYKSGRVSITGDGLFRVSGFEVDTGKMKCECPDYRSRRQPCKHIFASLLFIKNRAKQKIEHLESNGCSAKPETHPKAESKYGSTKPVEAHSKDFDRQSTITRLAVLNTATEILKTQRKPIKLADVISLASQLEQWALGK